MNDRMLDRAEITDEIDAQHLEAIYSQIFGGADNLQDLYPLTSLQEGMLFHYLLDDSQDTYMLSTLFELDSGEQVQALTAALQRVIERHNVLRSSVIWEGVPTPVQVVSRNVQLPVELIELDPATAAIPQLRERMTTSRRRMDLRRAPLVRLEVAQERSGSRWYALLQIHHIVCDNHSWDAVIEETLAMLRDGGGDLAPAAQYREHVAWAQAQDSAKEAERFFARKLGDVAESTAPFSVLDTRGQAGAITESRKMLGAALAQRIRFVAQQLRFSPARLFHAAWALVIAHTSAREDVVFGTVVLAAQRVQRSRQPMLGMFVNTLPLRLKLAGLTARELLQHTDEELTQLRCHEQTPLTLASRCSGADPLFTSLLNFRRTQFNPLGRASDVAGVRLVAKGEAWSSYPVTLIVDDLGEGFDLTAQTVELVAPERILRYVETVLEALLTALVEASGTLALSLPILPADERASIIEGFNATFTEYPRDHAVHTLFEEYARRLPDAVAVTHEGRAFTYAELNSQANRLAHHLRRQGVRPGDYVPVVMARSVEMLVAQIAVLKCGGAYVPLEPDLPHERRCLIIEDCRARCVLTRGVEDVVSAADQGHCLAWETLSDVLSEGSAANLDIAISPLSPAYVMYTSGSTGAPKGVIVPHRAVVRLAINNGYANIRPQDCLIHYSNPSFDASTFEIWCALLNGARVTVIAQDGVLDVARFASVLKHERVTLLWMSVGLFNEYAEHLREIFPQLRYLIVGGDVLEPGKVRAVLQESPPQHFLNAYGPTECTTFTTTHWVKGLTDADSRIPIGSPMANARVYILNERQQPVPIGVTGEIYIGGEGVALGYLNRPELTAARFVADPFGDSSSRLYRTGDLARWRADGAIEFIGRNDGQVKIRGFRIEVGEVEAQLSKHTSVKETVVVARDDEGSGKRLVAYVTSRTQPGPAVEELRTHLLGRLPEYMVPSAFVTLERLPLTPNGKVDRRALPTPDGGAYFSRQYEAPRGEVEEILAGLWQSLLGVERVGRNDNFFELGGHSLRIVQLMDRLRSVGLAADVRSVFDSPTLASLARALTREAADKAVVPPNVIPTDCEVITPQMLPLVQLDAQQIAHIVGSVPGGVHNVQDIYPLSPLQEGILFHHRLDDRCGDTYVLPIVLEVQSRERVDELIRALQAVIDRHDVLRTAVLWEQLPSPVQLVYKHAKLSVMDVEIACDVEPDEYIQEWLRPERQHIDIRRAPPLRAQVATDARRGKWYVVLQLHHITVDHMTWEVLTTEVVERLKGQVPTLPPSTRYRDHVAHALLHARTHDVEAFFRGKLGDVQEPTAPFELLDVYAGGAQIQELQADLDAEVSQRVRFNARRYGVSAATIFHAAWGLVVAGIAGRDDIVIGTVLLGRLQGASDAQRTLGMFINTLPLRLKLQCATAAQFVLHTQRELVELLGQEQASLTIAQRCSGITGSAPLFTTLLNYRHTVTDPAREWASAGGIRMLAIQDRTNYPITLSVDDRDTGFSFTAQTDRRIEPQRVIDWLQAALLSLLEALQNAPHRPLFELSILSPADRKEIEGFNATATAYPKDRLIHELVAEQVARTPSAEAVRHEGRSLTYAQLDASAIRVALELAAQGVGPDRLVGICAERSMEMVIGVLAILKAGGAYLPLDPNYPAERLQYMLEDAAPVMVLTQAHLKSVLPEISAPVLTIEGLLDATSEAGVPSPLGYEQSPNSLVYVIYTSGSTGRPKGTAMPHGAMVNLIEWHRERLPLRQGQRVLQFAALSFDVAFQEIFSTLCTGGALVLLDEHVRRDAQALMQLLKAQSIERLFMPPLMLQSLAECFKAQGRAPGRLKEVITAGEQLRISPEIIELFRHLPGCQLHNHYGPTETHVVTALTLTGDPASWPALPSIGRPIANTQIYLLDRHRTPVPVGVSAEIYIAGANVARGYLHRAQLTEERFVRDPFSADAQARMYRTGDVGRWRADGTIEYLGRNDDQVKIRGYRIELGEVERQLARHAAVKEAAVIAREDVPGEKRLAAYVTLRAGEAPSVEELRAHLKSSLPDYMVPSAFVTLERLPLTPSGKLDRRSLPPPQSQAYASERYEAPQGEVEQTLAHIWQDLLQIERVGRQDDFFELGGHSLLATQVIARLLSAFSVDVPMRYVFTYPCLDQLAEQVQQLRRAQLHERLAGGGKELEELLARVSSMSEDSAEELVAQLTTGQSRD